MSETIMSNCDTCGKSCHAETFGGITLSICDECAHAADEARARDELQKRSERAKAIIGRITPPRYRATNPEHAEFNSRLWERVKTWHPSSEQPWLGLTGATGTCKTRVAYLMMDLLADRIIREIRHREPAFEAIAAYDVARMVAERYGDNRHDAESGLDRIRRCDLLMLDDLGKQRDTPAVTAEIFALLDHRHAMNLPTVWTANAAPESILASWPPDLAAPLAGRLRECSWILTINSRSATACDRVSIG